MTLRPQAIKTTIIAFLISLSVSCADNETEYTGILDHRPEGKDGMWVIDGKSFSVTDDVELDDDDGPIEAGACVGLEMEDGDVREIETEAMDKCKTG